MGSASIRAPEPWLVQIPKDHDFCSYAADMPGVFGESFQMNWLDVRVEKVLQLCSEFLTMAMLCTLEDYTCEAHKCS